MPDQFGDYDTDFLNSTYDCVDRCFHVPIVDEDFHSAVSIPDVPEHYIIILQRRSDFYLMVIDQLWVGRIVIQEESI